MNERPNFLFLITDQLRADHLRCSGNSVVRTPNIDRLAESGVRFERAYVNNPLCMPARATLVTSLTSRGHGVRTNGIRLDLKVPTMPEALRQSGYRTHAVGKPHFGTFDSPRVAHLDTLDPADFPECHRLWEDGILKDLPPNYHGLETVDFCSGHGNYVCGH